MKHAAILKKPKTISAKVRDVDNPPWSEEMLGPVVLKKGRGAQRVPTKVATTIRIDADVLAHFRARGRHYQTRINDALRDAVKRTLAKGSAGRRSTTRSPLNCESDAV
jgi:uncharacterized protein (DUF4415 family)